MNKPAEERTVAEVMSADLLIITADESMLMAWELMCRAEVHHLPVVDQAGRCLGVVDATALASAWDSSGPHRPPEPIRPDATLAHAAAAMLATERDHLTMVDEHRRLIGLVTAHDLIAALAGAPAADGQNTTSLPSMYRMEPVPPEHTPAERTARHTVISPD